MDERDEPYPLRELIAMWGVPANPAAKEVPRKDDEEEDDQ